MSLATPIPLHRLGKLALVSRAGYYRWREEPADADLQTDRDLDLRDEIQRIALEHPSYGWPRITAELKRRGWKANHKRVYRIMREDNLLCLRRRKFLVATTDSNHTRPVYANLASGMELQGIDQLWVADITYIRLETEFVYLAVVLDACSRRVIGWALDRTLETELTLAALRMALELRHPSPGLVHHSDRGVQYASEAYTDLLKGSGITISMSRKRKSLRQCGLRVVHEDAEIRGGASSGIPRLDGSAGFYPVLPGTRIQPQTAAFRARLPTAGRVRIGVAEASRGGAGVRSSLRFPRHGGIYRSDVASKPSPPGLGVPPPVGRPPDSGKGRHGRNYAPCSSASSAVSSDRLFLDRVGRHQSPSPLHRHPHPKTVPGWGTMSLQRTANSVLTVCLSPWDNLTGPPGLDPGRAGGG
jgi:putative transposase